MDCFIKIYMYVYIPLVSMLCVHRTFAHSICWTKLIQLLFYYLSLDVKFNLLHFSLAIFIPAFVPVSFTLLVLYYFHC